MSETSEDSNLYLNSTEQKSAEPMKITKEIVNDKEVWFVGVEHTLPYLYAHEQEIRELVKKSEIIVPERFPFEEKELAFDSFVQERAILSDLLNDPQRIFFQQITDLAEEAPKKVAVVDPETVPVAVAGGILQIGGYALLGRTVEDFLTFLKAKESSGTKLSRRNFLKTLGKGALAFSLLSKGSVLSDTLSIMTNSKTAENYGVDDILSYSSIDYRDVCIAAGIDKLTKNLPKQTGGHVTVIYGRGHIDPVIAYLQKHQTVRDDKKIGYMPLARLGDQALRKYEFIDNSWIQQSREEY